MRECDVPTCGGLSEIWLSDPTTGYTMHVCTTCADEMVSLFGWKLK